MQTGEMVMRKVKPFIAAVGVVATAGMLVFAIYFTQLDLPWITFLSGVLAASLLAMVARATRAEFFAARRLARLSVVQEKLGREKLRRDELEKAFAAAQARLHFSEEVLPVMLAYVDAQARYQYHNRAFRHWLGLRKDQIDGRHMRDVHGRKGFAEIEPAVARVMDGELVQYERTQKMPSGSIYRLSTQYIPVRGDKGQVAGFCTLITDFTDRGVEPVPADNVVAAQRSQAELEIAAPNTPSSAGSEHGTSVDCLSQEVTGEKDAVDRIAAAIKKGEFALFYQPIRRLTPNAGFPDHYEILIRLREEEDNLIPPGAFFPLAEQHGLLPQLDRWVVEHLLEWMSSRKAGTAKGEIFFVNAAIDTICDPDFPDFVEDQLRKNAVPASAVCFEITETGLNSRRSEVERFARMVKQSGARIALSGFGRARVSVDLLKTCPLDFVKIDGSVILGIQRNAFDLGKLTAITRVSKVIGVSTVAEMVETEEMIAKLRELNVDFAQGFGISRPRALSALSD
jgi:PAS domain S-box-containing protein